FTLTGVPVAFQTANYTLPDWINDAIPGGSWMAGQPTLTAGAEMFDGLTVYAGQLGVLSVWEVEEPPEADSEEAPLWFLEAIPCGSWGTGQPVITAGAEMFDGLTVYAGQLGETSVWELEVQ